MNLLMDTAGKILERLFDIHPQGGWGGGALFYYPSRTNDIMNAVLILSHFFAIAVEKIRVIVIAFEYMEHNKFHQTNQLNCAGSTLFTMRTDLSKIPCLRQTGQKPYPVQQHIPQGYTTTPNALFA